MIRYGKGVVEAANDDSSSDGDEDEEQDAAHLPCPVLEFRVINRLNSTKGGEIMDATMNVVASIDESQAGTTVRRAARGGRRRKGRQRRRPSRNVRAAIPHTVSEQRSLHGSGLGLSLSHDDESVDTFQQGGRGKTYQAFEDLDGECVSRRIFAKLELETPDHPFFKRVWTACHTLNAESPLLSTETRRRIRDNHGFWPPELNNYSAVRACIHFDQILVSLSGTSNADANSVYSQKVYDYVDGTSRGKNLSLKCRGCLHTFLNVLCFLVNVGYRFANVLYRNLSDGSLQVDLSIINDVLEQEGGGAEPLNGDSLEKRASDMLIM